MSPSIEKRRLDRLLVERGLAENGTRAQALIRAGEVLVDERPIDKPGTQVPVDSAIRVKNLNEDASRGAGKLRSALERFPIDISGKIAADLGASTGGFTQVLLERGAKIVHAFDVGYGLLHESLRKDPRVIVHDRTNVRYLDGSEMEPAGIVTMDLSFIGLDLVLPAVAKIASPTADCIALVKPQFEAGKEHVGKGGIVRDPKIQEQVLRKHLERLKATGFYCLGLIPSAIKGKKGNQEYLTWFRKATGALAEEGIVDVDAVLREAGIG
jgi:23S rRNA (cytidine1920-2'-O)/16S rRNA (cytidine1409-2'-O)-methyltransferase